MRKIHALFIITAIALVSMLLPSNVNTIVYAAPRYTMKIATYAPKNNETIVLPAKQKYDIYIISSNEKEIIDYSKIKYKSSNKKVVRTNSNDYIQCLKKGNATLTISYKKFVKKIKIKVIDSLGLKGMFDNDDDHFIKLVNNSKQTIKLLGYSYYAGGLADSAYYLQNPIVLKSGDTYQIEQFSDDYSEHSPEWYDHHTTAEVSGWAIKIGKYNYLIDSLSGKIYSYAGKKCALVIFE